MFESWVFNPLGSVAKNQRKASEQEGKGGDNTNKEDEEERENENEHVCLLVFCQSEVQLFHQVCESQGSSSGHQALWQVPLST